MLLFTMIAVAVALPEACGPPPGAAPKYYISFNGSDITGDGSRENPFASPQGACFVMCLTCDYGRVSKPETCVQMQVL
eukprot:881319-Amorphochlora_amoeboformis.AAC.1